MKNNNWQFTNLKISKRLEALGVEQVSMFKWHKKTGKNMTFEIIYYPTSDLTKNIYSAFSVAELGEGLPGNIIYKNRNYHLQTQKWCNKWQFFYKGTDKENLGEYLNNFLQGQEDTEANARGLIKIHLTENEIMKVKDEN